MENLSWRIAVVGAMSFVVLATSFLVSSASAQTAVDLPTGVRMHFVAQGPAGARMTACSPCCRMPV